MAVIWKRNMSYLSGDMGKYYDFVISGGGMIGSTLACTLGKTPLLKDKSILLIENSSKPHPIKSYIGRTYSNRVSAVNPKSREVFENCGIWNHISNARYNTVKDIKVWGEYSQLSTSFSLLPEEDLAYIVENDLIVEAATEEIQNMNNVTISYNTKVSDVILPSGDELPTIILKNGDKVQCNLLIGADGANSLIREKIGFHYLSFDYKQFGIVATLQVGVDGPNNVAWQKFLRNGPVALLPLNEKMSSLVWTTSRDEAEMLLSMSDDSFVDALNTAINAPPKQDPLVSSVQGFVQTAMDTFKLTSKQQVIMPPYVISIEPKSRAKFPLSFGHASEYVKSKICLIGDSAHKVHPLAGQGVNLGFNDISVLTKIISEGIRNGHPIGNLGDLKKYEAATLKHNLPVMAGINLFHNIFVTDLTPLKVIANSSFLIADSIGPLKKVMRQFASN